MDYKKSYKPSKGFTPICEIGKCSLKMLEFGIIELGKDETLDFETHNKEVAFIFLEGRANVSIKETIDFGLVGKRKDVFSGKAEAVYVPRNRSVKLSTPWSCKIAVIGTPLDEDTSEELITQDKVRAVTLGVQPYQRDTHFIIDGTTNARRLTIGEAWVTPGNWAGFPPHKHDVDSMPKEGVAEEIYYFLFHPKQGFAIQSMYTTDGEIDECYRVRENDLVEFPYGYHTTVGAPGYNTYFLWMMAGEHQGFYRSNDEEREWVTAVENIIKKS